MKISELLDENAVCVDLESEDKDELFAEMVELLVRAGRVGDREAALKSLREREYPPGAGEMSTGIGDGVAMPHGTAAVDELTLAVGLSKQGIDYNAVDSQPVYAVFMMLIPPGDPAPYIEALAALARLLLQPGFLDRLCRAQSAAEALETIRQAE